MNISMIACVGKNLELGKNNSLLWHLPNDLKFFKEITLGKTVIMGKKTFDSLPQKLPNRRNIVMSRKNNVKISGVDMFNNIDAVLEEINRKDDEAFVIGGGSIYQQFLPYAKKIYLTEVDKENNQADVYFPQFDKSKYKRTVIANNHDGDIYYKHVLYERR